MHSFFAPGTPSVGDVVTLSAEEALHAGRVLRLVSGEKIELISEAGRRFLAEFQEGARAYVLEALADNEPPLRVTLFMGMPKADKLDFVVQKATELGAYCVAPVQMERSVALWEPKDVERRLTRLERIAREATKQCGRALPPRIHPPRPLSRALTEFSGDLLIMPWEKAAECTLRNVCEAVPDVSDMGILIGPEGGISEEEATLATTYGARPVTLGPRILRAETAAVASLALVMGLWGDLC